MCVVGCATGVGKTPVACSVPVCKLVLAVVVTCASNVRCVVANLTTNIGAEFKGMIAKFALHHVLSAAKPKRNYRSSNKLSALRSTCGRSPWHEQSFPRCMGPLADGSNLRQHQLPGGRSLRCHRGRLLTHQR